jgi:hypothetical protein
VGCSNTAIEQQYTLILSFNQTDLVAAPTMQPTHASGLFHGPQLCTGSLHVVSCAALTGTCAAMLCIVPGHPVLCYCLQATRD